jgi:alpha-L-fucosidase 2
MALPLFDLSGKAAVVSGGTTGIERPMALSLADTGTAAAASSGRTKQVSRIAEETESRSKMTLRISPDVISSVLKGRILSKTLSIQLVVFALLYQASAGLIEAQSPTLKTASAWHDGRFQVDVPGVIGRSNIVLDKPNLEDTQSMPLGNGRLGVAVWSANGFTAQLNRNDTLPARLSPGRIEISGLTRLTQAKDYAGRLDLYRGEFQERGGGMTATAYVEPDNDVLIVDVSGADPTAQQTAILRLWAPRTPQALAKRGVGLLAQSWVDDKNPGASGRAFGSIAVITAQARDVSAVVTDPLTVTVSFKPDADGRFRIIAASPHYDGKGNTEEIASSALLTQPDASHRNFWKDFWNRAAVIRISSRDGAGEYMENLRNIYLYIARIEKGVEYPGTHAGIGDMISSVQDSRRWDPSAFWHWNLRMQVAANIGAGLTELNEPYFNLYRENLANIENWTKEHMRGLPGICVPETMRFNGQGIEDEGIPNPYAVALDCDANFVPYYNARTLSTGAEVSLWVWQQYLATNDREFLAENYPLMASSARFLLAYQKMGADGQLHTSPSNAHEQQWDVTDPTTDISAIMALYPATIQAAGLLGKDPDLIRQLQAALPKVPPLPRAAQNDTHKLLAASADAEGEDVIAESWLPAAGEHNFENVGLEPVWPYNLIGDTSPLFALARRTYYHRPNPVTSDWGPDPIHAARLQLSGEVESTLVAITQKFQRFVNGMAQFEPNSKEFYVEQTGVVADALQEALVQDYDGVIRIAPATPSAWDFDGSVYVRGNTKVDVQTRNGAVFTAVIEAGMTQSLKVRNPWPGKRVDVISGSTGKKVVSSTAEMGSEIEFTTTAGSSYLIKSHDEPTEGDGFAPVSGAPASSPKRLGPVQIGLFNENNDSRAVTHAEPRSEGGGR